jgi:hypothetical protein
VTPPPARAACVQLAGAGHAGRDRPVRGTLCEAGAQRAVAAGRQDGCERATRTRDPGAARHSAGPRARAAPLSAPARRLHACAAAARARAADARRVWLLRRRRARAADARWLLLRRRQKLWRRALRRTSRRPRWWTSFLRRFSTCASRRVAARSRALRTCAPAHAPPSVPRLTARAWHQVYYADIEKPGPADLVSGDELARALSRCCVLLPARTPLAHARRLRRRAPTSASWRTWCPPAGPPPRR